MKFLESLLRINCLKMGLSSSQLEKEIASDQLLSGERYFGLVNFGNTCYCNSVIQALFFCKPFRDKVLQYNDRAKNPKKETLLTCLSDLFYSVVSQQRRVGQMRPKKFIQKLKRENGLFDNYLQQDAHEFLNYLLNKIADIIRAEQQSTDVEGDGDSNDSEVSDVSENMNKHNGQNWIHEIFQGSLTNETRCLNCDNVRTKEENFLDLSVDVGENVDISYCLRCFSETETMRSDNKYYCEFCRCKQEAQRRMRIKKPPLLLALHLKRFKYSENLNRFIKLSYRVAFPMELRLFNTSSDSSNADRLYSLMAVVVHSGSGPNRGHYITLVKSHGLWFLFDDELVEKIHRTNIEDFFGSSTETSKSSYTAYILFYLDAKVASTTSTSASKTASTIINSNTSDIGGSNGSPTSSMSS
ncbi:hypothetical protein MN116_005025 [Schistosoma mekongi]|uniref:Ubiquitin carboxyl-terminal hydrolase n=1 Tax=Schistosoma mekongi TaxID=38744 RepID=A0AAE1ZDU0_SCHME|nr:hypothetical protein MN116_005025 [Schistosoma mekongi]